MTDAERSGADHIVLPRRSAGLALLERYRPPPADNVLDAELAAFAAPGDTVLDPWAGTGWTARRAISAEMRSVAADASPFGQLAAIAFLTAPEPAVLDAAFAQLAASRRVDVPLRQHLDELYASRCAACRRPVVVDQFIWPREGDAPGRKVYRCSGCDASLGGPEERVAPVDEIDLAKLGLDRPSGQAAPLTVDDAMAEEASARTGGADRSGPPSLPGRARRPDVGRAGRSTGPPIGGSPLRVDGAAGASPRGGG